LQDFILRCHLRLFSARMRKNQALNHPRTVNYILVAAHGTFVFSLGIVLIVGRYTIKATTTSTVHTEPSIPTVGNSVMVSQYTSIVLYFTKHYRA
jgi:hypothetical protein